MAEKQAGTKPNSVPLYVGFAAAALAIALSLFGMIRNTGLASLTPVSIVLVILIAGGSWGVVAWALTTAVYDVEEDVAQNSAPEQRAPAGKGT